MKRPTEEEQRVVLIGGWLARYDDMFDTYGKGIDQRPHLFDDFCEALADVSTEQLAAVFEQWRREGKKFPSPGDLRGLLVKRQELEDQYASEKAFDHVRWVCQFFCYAPDRGLLPICVGPDAKLTPRIQEACTKEEFRGGFLLRPKPFDRATQSAIANVGGLERISSLPAGSEFDFVRKGFIQVHRRFVETAGYTAISRDEAKQVMEKLTKELPK